MGNCINTLLLSPSLNNNQENEELNDLANDQNLSRTDEEMMQYYVVQQCHSPVFLSNVTPSTTRDSQITMADFRLCSGNCSSKKYQRIKIVLTKQQLELLVSDVKEYQCDQIPIQSCKRWKPSLVTIPEL
ncbi:hypothetical protein HAX54_014893 [Datura stramonium]|uniref:Uncharacterized protein n=1 Tax=Datura stramonium TaxID=4076 RepID=A0ABS8RZP6_DATST|nr:hypothetical protein [Datura stramonium]